MSDPKLGFFAYLIATISYLTKELETDALTGCISQRFYLPRLVDSITAARRYRQYITIIRLDVNRFKSINDNYGHPTGDMVLRTLTQYVNVNRPDDFMARVGGDEFVLALRDCRKDDAEKRVKTLLSTAQLNINRRLVKCDVLPNMARCTFAGVSLGYAEIDPRLEEDPHAIAIQFDKVADMRAYQQKRRPLLLFKNLVKESARYVAALAMLALFMGGYHLIRSRPAIVQALLNNPAKAGCPRGCPAGQYCDDKSGKCVANALIALDPSFSRYGSAGADIRQCVSNCLSVEP